MLIEEFAGEVTEMLVPFSVGPGESRMVIPESWTVFVYRGFLYVRGDDGRFVCRGTWPKAEAKKTA